MKDHPIVYVVCDYDGAPIKIFWERDSAREYKDKISGGRLCSIHEFKVIR